MAFVSLVGAALHVARDFHERGEDDVVFAFFCRRGRRRSAAAAELAFAELRRIGFQRTRAEHIDLGDMPCSVKRCIAC